MKKPYFEPITIYNSEMGSVFKYFMADRKNEYKKEIYISMTKGNCINAWKLHKKNTIELYCIKGSCRVVIADIYKNIVFDNQIKEFSVHKLIIPSMMWFAFSTMNSEDGVGILNSTRSEFDEQELERKPVSFINVDW